MNNRQSPLRLKVSHFAIWNSGSSERIDHFDRIISQNEFRSDPEDMNACSEYQREEKLEASLHWIAYHQDAIRYEEKNENEGDTSPYEVAPWAKGVVHMPSIAGERK